MYLIKKLHQPTFDFLIIEKKVFLNQEITEMLTDFIDFTRVGSRKIALKFAYLGANYDGISSKINPNRPAISRSSNAQFQNNRILSITVYISI
jgi:hypothetical protein